MPDPRPPSPEVGGFVPLSTTDWPGRLAAVVFVQGCPWRCSYCHNPGLQARHAVPSQVWREVARTLGRRVGLLDGVVFSGGEPTLDAGLPDAIDEVRAMGLQVGLHTAGIYPERLESLLGRLDWVGLDVKTGFDSYGSLTGVPRSGEAARRSLDALLASGVAHELRTTYHPMLIADDDLLGLAHELKAAGAAAWVLQRWRPTGGDSSPELAAAWRWPDAALIEALRSQGPVLELR